MQTLIDNVHTWAEDRNLIEGSDVSRQFLKLMEEFGEFLRGLTENDTNEIVDGMGDYIVVLLIISKQLEVPISSSDFKTGPRKGNIRSPMISLAIIMEITMLNGKLGEGIAKGNLPKAHLAILNIARRLSELATELGLTVSECLKAAYDEIKDRKGKMVNGVFIKE